MKSFLSRVISDVLQKVETPLEHQIFVLPSQRACVFLKHELKAQLNKASFLPKIISIESYIQEIADISQIDQVQLIFEFYSVYKKCTPEEAVESFDQFYKWATVVLQDFNEVDRHLIDAKDLFTYLRDINRLNNWTPNTEITKNYFSFFERLNTYYFELYQHLLEQKKGYQGLIYREAENNIQHYLNNIENKHVTLVGFNALNKAEEHIFQELLQNGNASIYWDVDKSYLEKSNTTGTFVRKYKSEWSVLKNTINWVDDHFSSSEQEIQIIGAAKNVSQLKYAGEILSKQDKFNNTALVLADESLLPLMLNSLPNGIDKINITMGLSLRDMPLSNFFESIFNLFLNQEKLGLVKKNAFYYKDILNLINNPFYKTIEKESEEISQFIGKNNLIFVSTQEISELCNSKTLDLLLIQKLNGVHDLIQRILDGIHQFKDEFSGIEKEYLMRFYAVFQQFLNLNNKFNYIKDLKTLHHFFNQLVRNEKMAFQGEPLEGLQLMGMLETRVIDFETVILTSMNEGILPASKQENSFIPFDVKKHVGLPTYQEKDAIFSYHFYRLLQRAKKVFLLYNTEKDAYGTGEKSRFLTQLEINRPEIKQALVGAKVSMAPKELLEIPKSKELQIELQQLAAKGISPSALTSYINNPIDFYYQKILKIREVEEVEETVAVNTMGTVIHETLEELYTPYINSILTEGVIKKMKSISENLVISNFNKVYVNGNIATGKNKLIFEVSKKYLDRFLNMELADVKAGKEIKIIALEQKLSYNLKVDGIDFPIKLGGIVDRIDEVDGVLRILDYKTGMVKAADLKLNDFSKMKLDYKYTKAMQVMLYAFLYKMNSEDSGSSMMEAGIISFKNLNNGFLKMNFGEGRSKDNEITSERLENYIEDLKQILIEIFDASIPFKENPDKKF
ncbi:PD-(D/E)XK nuclease family protein [Urechidicola vernalis]|uniref:PD-(D/E)XK nuclease family protein n=1 Tax=Urechidicola vernalis TaxID=3075600 RepID=A0ABU2Y675_9FLAO|nr:PD-(D/E)XK nuclease family protein [Urechidicola sp. P050]MDT0553704.1 PD-(D/E)XK nuclease family protein [Urechidicola sp. P050]